jgi:hypothetical protein
MARLQQANPSPEAEAAMAYLRVATTLVEEKSVTSKSVSSSSSQHSRSRSNRPAHNKLPTIQEEVDQNNPDQPRVNDTRDGDLHANLRLHRPVHREREAGEPRRRAKYDCEYGPPGVVHRIMEHEERATPSRTSDVLSTRWNTTTRRVVFRIQIASPGPRSSLLLGAEVVLKPETMVMIWPSQLSQH